MVVNKKVVFWLLAGMFNCVVSAANADGPSVLVDKKPDFTNYPANISQGPFATKLDLTNKQEKYSLHWKKITINELKKSVNLAGHYRIYTDDKSSGSECFDHQGGVCGWVIDKFSGKVVMSLPSVDGNDSYNQVADNGTPVGEEFKLETKSNSSLVILTGQAISQKLAYDKDGIPITYPCETIYYRFEKNQFIKVFEDKNGCSVE